MAASYVDDLDDLRDDNPAAFVSEERDDDEQPVHKSTKGKGRRVVCDDIFKNFHEQTTTVSETRYKRGLPATPDASPSTKEKRVRTAVPLSFCLKPQRSKLVGQTFYEPVDRARLNLLMHSSLLAPEFKDAFMQQRFENEKAMLEAYEKLIDPMTSLAEVKYFRTTSMDYGREYPVGALGGINFRKFIRHTLWRDIMEDIDLVRVYVALFLCCACLTCGCV
jgi:hypothetical protein